MKKLSTGSRLDTPKLIRIRVVSVRNKKMKNKITLSKVSAMKDKENAK